MNAAEWTVFLGVALTLVYAVVSTVVSRGGWLVLPISEVGALVAYLVLMFKAEALAWQAARGCRRWVTTLAFVSLSVVIEATCAARAFGQAAHWVGLIGLVPFAMQLAFLATFVAAGRIHPRHPNLFRRMAFVPLVAVLLLGCWFTLTVYAEAAVAVGDVPAGPVMKSGKGGQGAGGKKGPKKNGKGAAVVGQTGHGGPSSVPTTVAPGESADELCGVKVADHLVPSDANLNKVLLATLLQRGAGWAGCPLSAPVTVGSLTVWLLDDRNGAPHGALLEGPQCSPVVVAPDRRLRAAVISGIEDGSLVCATAWTRAGSSRYQTIEHATAPCTVFLERTVKDPPQYHAMPAAVADLAFDVSQQNGGRPFVATVTGQPSHRTYEVMFDFPSQNAYGLDAVKISYDSRTLRATTIVGSEHLTSTAHDCPAFPTALSRTQP